MEDKGYTVIPDWMLNLDLDIYEVIILAVIYGFSQDGESSFTGSQAYLARKAKCSRAKVTRVLPKLVDKGYLKKIDRDVRGVHLCEYKVYLTDTGCISRIQGGCIPETHNNIDNKNIDNTLSITRTGGFKKPSIEEIHEYCLNRNNKVDAEQFYDFYESNGWMVGKNRMKDWKAAVRTWEKRAEKEIAPRKRERRETVFEHNLRAIDAVLGTDMHGQYYGRRDTDEQ